MEVSSNYGLVPVSVSTCLHCGKRWIESLNELFDINSIILIRFPCVASNIHGFIVVDRICSCIDLYRRFSEL